MQEGDKAELAAIKAELQSQWLTCAALKPRPANEVMSLNKRTRNDGPGSKSHTAGGPPEKLRHSETERYRKYVFITPCHNQ